MTSSGATNAHESESRVLRHLQSLMMRLMGTYWFIPTLMCCGSFVSAAVVAFLDTHLYHDIELPWFYINSPEGARSVLSTIAGSVITVAGVSFSITVVALTVTSTQHGPHVLNNLMRDRGNQVVLGTFTSTFLYCLLVLRTVHGTTDEFSLALSLVFAVVLAVASIAVLIYFVHHISILLQVESLIARLVSDFDAALERVYPERLGTGTRQSAALESALGGHSIEATKATGDRLTIDRRGYLQELRPADLMDKISKHDCFLVMAKRPGDFLIPGETLSYVVPIDGDNLSPAQLDALNADVNQVLGIGRGRSCFQDIRYPAIQLVDMAMRALSPGVCDLLTANACIDELGSALAAMIQREQPSPYRLDDDGVLRLVAFPVHFNELLDDTFGLIIPIIPPEQVCITKRTMEILAMLSALAPSQKELAAIQHYAEMLFKRGAAAPASEYQRAALADIKCEIHSAPRRHSGI